jgi:hypothetical protein
MDHVFYDQKDLIQRWSEGNRPAIRIGTVHTKKEELAKYLTRPTAVTLAPATGSMTVECSYQRGLESRLKIRNFNRDPTQGPKGLAELFWEATQSTDELPLARAKPGVAQELLTAGGGQLPEAKVTRGLQNPKASGEALAKKQAKRQRQKSEKSDDQIADEFARKMCREHTGYLRIASASYMRCPEEYYDSYAGVWTPPAVGEVYDHTHTFTLGKGTDPIPQFVQAAIPKQKKRTRQHVVNQARQAETISLANLVSTCTPSGSQLAETGGPGIVGRQLVEGRISSTFADTAHYTLTTQRDYTSRGSASGLQAPAPAIGVGTEQQADLMVSKGYKILMKKVASDDAASALLRIEEQPPLINIAFAWTKTAANKINRDRRMSKQTQESGASSSGAFSAPIAFVGGEQSEPAPSEALPVLSSDSEPGETEAFAWARDPVTGTCTVSADPTELATAFAGSVWNVLEEKLDSLAKGPTAKQAPFETKELRETIQKTSEYANIHGSGVCIPYDYGGTSAGASSSSAAAASSSQPELPQPIDTTTWESDEKFKFNLKYLAWMLRKSGGPAPVFVDPGTDNPMEIDYSIDE